MKPPGSLQVSKAPAPPLEILTRLGPGAPRWFQLAAAAVNTPGEERTCGGRAGLLCARRSSHRGIWAPITTLTRKVEIKTVVLPWVVVKIKNEHATHTKHLAQPWASYKCWINITCYCYNHFWGKKEMKVLVSVVSDSETLWTVACQVPLFLGFSRQEYWSGLPFPAPEDLPNPGIKTRYPVL